MSRRSGRRRRRGAGRVLVAAALLVFAALFHDRWGPWWASWWQGPLAADGQLLGLSILAWGRFGKVFQFAAGLVIILDLIGPDALRAYGTRGRRRLTTARRRITYTRVAARVLDKMQVLENRVKKDLPPTGEREQPPPLSIDDDTYQTLLDDVFEAFDGELTCRSCTKSVVTTEVQPQRVSIPGEHPSKWDCLHGRTILGPYVEAAVLDDLTNEEKAAWRYSGRGGVQRWALGGSCLGLLVGVGGAMLILKFLMPVVPFPLAVTPALLLFWSGSAFAIIASEPDQRRSAAIALMWLWALVQHLPVLPARFITHLMDRAQPAHPLRWAAAYLFIAGSLLDLLAS
ncbi:hypothetical protein [Kribbella sp. NPDC049227]|uniref:hypothetical protein n=1 Tax=Kribbella sp. NPDC049227 TaxID=3364113 RepID=UPI00371A7B9D